MPASATALPHPKATSFGGDESSPCHLEDNKKPAEAGYDHFLLGLR